MDSSETVEPDSMEKKLNQKSFHYTQLIKILMSSKSDPEKLKSQAELSEEDENIKLIVKRKVIL